MHLRQKDAVATSLMGSPAIKALLKQESSSLWILEDEQKKRKGSSAHCTTTDLRVGGRE